MTTRIPPWCIVNSEGVSYLDNIEYLNYLLGKSPEIIKSQDKIKIKFLYWDFQELKEEGKLSPIHNLTIQSQLNSLNRILKYTPIQEYIKNFRVETSSQNLVSEP